MSPSTASCDMGAVMVTVAPEALVASATIGVKESIVGAVLSCTVTVKLVWSAALPCESAASHLTVVSPIAKVEPEVGLHDAVPVSSTASLVAGGVYVTAAPADEVASAVSSPCAAITGLVLSCTVTVKLVWSAALPCESVASHLTSVVPIANTVPEAGEHVATPTPSTASLVTGEVYSTVAPEAEVASSVTGSCAAITSLVLSCTVTVKDVGFAAFPAVSVAVHVTVVSPIMNVVPDAGRHDAVPVPSTASCVAGESYVTAAPAYEVASRIMSEGVPLMTGWVVSLTVILNEAVPVLPAASVAVQFTVILPKAKVEPEARSHAGVIEPSMASKAEAVKLTEAPLAPVASTIISDGTVTTGAVVSFVAVLVPVPVFPAASVWVAVAIRAFVPSVNPLKSSVAVHALDVQVGVAVTSACPAPETFSDIVRLFSQAPPRPTNALFALFTVGKVVTVMLGAVLSIFTISYFVVSVFPALSIDAYLK